MYETERKFLINSDQWRASASPIASLILQGYMCVKPAEVRVRIQCDCTQTGEPFGKLTASLTVLGERNADGSREVFNYSVPVIEANRMLTLCKYQLKKIRHKVGELTVDEFLNGVHKFTDGQGTVGLRVAELKQLSDIEPQLPDWIGEEVTGQISYSSAWIAKHKTKNEHES
jgi:CYTH domain-containing protein